MHAHETSYSLCINILVNKINQIFVFTANRGQGHMYRNKKSKRESGLFTQFPLQTIYAYKFYKFRLVQTTTPQYKKSILPQF